MKIFLRLFPFLFIFISVSVNAQSLFNNEEENGESSETIFERERFIYERRAGGPGKKLPKDAFTKALIQKNLIQKDSEIDGPTSAVSWVSVNPTGMFYNLTGSNYISGRTNFIAFHPTNQNIFYIAAAQGGVWKTTDGGANWTALTDGLTSLASGSIAVDKNNPNVIYYGTGEMNFSLDCQYGDGLFKSTDGGSTWTRVVPYSSNSYYSTIVIDPTNSNIVYAAGTSGVYKTTNAGTNWTKQTTTSGNYTSLVIDGTNPAILFASTYSGEIFKTTNSGNNWTLLGSTNGLPASGGGRIQLAISDVNSAVVYASIENSSSGALLGVYKTTNSGANWTLQSSSTNYLGSQGWYDNSIVVKPGDANFIIVGGLDVYTSSNSGVNFTKVSTWGTSTASQFTHADIHYFAYNGSTLYCLSDGGIYKSTNHGTSWTDLNAKISTLQYQSADCDPNNANILYGGCQDNNKQTSTNGGSVWIQRTTGDGGYTVVDPVSTNYVYGQYVNGSVQRSANSGVSFSEFSPSSSTGGLFYNPYELAPGDPNTMVYAQDDIWKTTSARTATSSTGWTQIATNTTVGGSVSSLAISPLSTSKIYAGTSGGKILTTTNNGTNWISKTGFNYVSDLFVDNSNDNICYAAFGGITGVRVGKTTDGGNNWVSISGNLPSIAVNSIVVKFSGARTIYVGTDVGVYYSVNEGATWVAMNTGLPAVQVYDLKYKESLKILLAATHGRGCFKFDLNTTFYNTDVGVYANITPMGIVNINTPVTLAPKATIKNFGLTNQNLFNVSCVITGPQNYSSTKNISALAAGDTIQLTFDSVFTPQPGNYSMKVITQLIGDEARSNDTMITTFSAYNYNYGGGTTATGGYYYANSTNLTPIPSQPQYNWIDPVSAGHSVLSFSNFDDGTSTVNLGFSFPYMGSNFTSVNVYTNGYLNFGSAGSTTVYTVSAIPSAGNHSNLVAPGIIDLDFTTSRYPAAKIYYGGDASKFVITYFHGYKWVSGGNSTDYLTMQVILYSNGNIKFQYNDTESFNYFTTFTPFCDIGMQNSTGTSGIQYRLDNVGGAMFSSPVAVEFGLNQNALPVELSSFTANVSGNKVALNWKTDFEQNNSGYEIQRKTSSGDWTKIGFVEGKGTVTEQSNYFYEDRNLNSGRYHYRLKQIDYNGNLEYFSLNNEVIVGVPAKFALGQNYPNPFNPVTTIAYEIPAANFVSLKVYDLTGKEVASLVNEKQEAGFYLVKFDGTKLSSGVYFYSLKSNDFTATKKLLLVK